MEQVIEGFVKNGELYLFENIKAKFARVKIILSDAQEEDFKRGSDFLLKNRLKIQTKNFNFNRAEIYDRKSLS